MDLRYTPEEEAFRAEVRAFLQAELPAEIRDKMRLGRRLCKDDLVRWQRILHRPWLGSGDVAEEIRRRRMDGGRSNTFSRRNARPPARRRRLPSPCGW